MENNSGVGVVEWEMALKFKIETNGEIWSKFIHVKWSFECYKMLQMRAKHKTSLAKLIFNGPPFNSAKESLQCGLW